MSHYEFGPSPANSYYDSGSLYSPVEEHNPSLDLAVWNNDPDLSSHSPSSSISIPSHTDTTSSFIGYKGDSHFSPDQAAFSPTFLAALHPLPRSISPPSLDETYSVRPRLHNSGMHPALIVDASALCQAWESPVADTTVRQHILSLYDVVCSCRTEHVVVYLVKLGLEHFNTYLFRSRQGFNNASTDTMPR